MRSNFRLVPFIIAMVIAVVAIAIAQWRAATPPRVNVIAVSPQTLTTTLALTGEVEAVEQAAISSTLEPLTIVAVMVEKGDRVTRGQPLIQLDTSELSAALRRARASVAVAKANLLRARASAAGAVESTNLSSARLEAVTELRAAVDSARAAVATNEARVRQAQEARLRTLSGGRPEEIAVAEARLRAAQTDLELQTTALRRAETLLAQGAVSVASVDGVRALKRSAEEQVNVAQAQLALARTPRREDVQQAEAVVREAEAGLAGARDALANAERTLRERFEQRSNTVTAATTRNAAAADVEVALASLRQAEAQEMEAAARLARATLVSPIDGVVSRRDAQPGESAGSGQILLRLTTTRTFRISADVEEKNLPLLSVGQTAIVSSPALPGQTMEARVSEINRSAERETGTVEVRFDLQNAPAGLREFLTVDVNVTLRQASPVMLVPSTAVDRQSAPPKVFVVGNGNRVIARPVRVGRPATDGIEILSGIEDGDRVVVDAATVSDGQLIAPKDGSSDDR